MLRTILVALDGSPYTETVTSLAIDWGMRFGARLLGLGILDIDSIAGREAVPIGGSSYKKERDGARIVDTHGRVQSVLSQFQERCSAAGVSADIFEDVGNPAVNILRHAHGCDVVMLGRETHFHFDTKQSDATLSEVLRGCPRPIVVVPPELQAGEGVIVAYGGGREVAHTLQTFYLLGLAAGETIHVLSVQREGWEAGALARLACDFLESHGAQFQLHDVISKAAPADVLLEQAEKLRPRLLVMGAHGHHSLRDLFATSVTRDVLRACPVPVLIGA
jgi:nucleotide-binding universal stress UspA family protein